MSSQEGRLEKIKVAKVVNTHGIRGEVKAILLTDFTDRFAELKEVYIEKNNSYQTIKLQSVRWNKDQLLIKFEGVDTPEQGALLKNKYLMINFEDRVPLPKDNFYHFEIIGLEGFNLQGVKLGIVQDILQTSANDVYVVQRDGVKELLIPALKKVIKQVDLENKRMVVELLPGLLEEEG